MSTKKAKSKAAAKRKPTNARKTKPKPKPTSYGGGPKGSPVTHWSQWIEPKGAALLAQTLMPCHFVVKNHGPESLRLVAQNGDLMDLPSGKVRATYAHRTVTVENRSEKWVLIEFDFVPIHVMR
jgi:hypothetical protein